MGERLEPGKQIRIMSPLFNFAIVSNTLEYPVVLRLLHDELCTPLLIIEKGENEGDLDLVKKIKSMEGAEI